MSKPDVRVILVIGLGHRVAMVGQIRQHQATESSKKELNKTQLTPESDT